MEEWKEYKLEEICMKITDGSHSSPRAQEYGYPMFSVKDMLEYGFDYSKCKYISKEDFLILKQNGCVPQKGDVLVAKDGSYLKQIFVCKQTKEEGILSSIAIFRPNELVDSYFLCYLLKSPQVYNYIANNCVSGSALPRIVLKDFKSVKLQIPSKETQINIVSKLKSLDDKIECNRRINDNFTLSFLLLTCLVLWLLKLRNDNLQQQADALFKSWFIDFKPFIDGEFTKTELGIIPKNWKIFSFGDFIVALTEKAPVDSLPEYSVTNNGIIPRDTKFNKKLSKSSSMNKVLRKDNLVFGMSREILNWGIMEDEIGGVSSAYNIYKIDDGLVNPAYLRLYMNAKIAEFNSLIGTAAREGQSLDKGQLMQKKIYEPTEDVLQDFFGHYVPIMKSIHNSEQESSRLAQLRDALLPKLMSGELEIS